MFSFPVASAEMAFRKWPCDPGYMHARTCYICYNNCTTLTAMMITTPVGHLVRTLWPRCALQEKVCLWFSGLTLRHVLFSPSTSPVRLVRLLSALYASSMFSSCPLRRVWTQSGRTTAVNPPPKKNKHISFPLEHLFYNQKFCQATKETWMSAGSCQFCN